MEFSQSIFVSREVTVRSPLISLRVSFRKPGADRKPPQQSKNGFAPLSLGLKQSSSLRALAPTGWMMMMTMMYNEILLLVISYFHDNIPQGCLDALPTGSLSSWCSGSACAGPLLPGGKGGHCHLDLGPGGLTFFVSILIPGTRTMELLPAFSSPSPSGRPRWPSSTYLPICHRKKRKTTLNCMPTM